MTKTAEDLLFRALELAETERAEIAGALIRSLEPGPDEGVETAWREEVRRRLRALEAGEGSSVSWEEVREQLSSRLDGES